VVVKNGALWALVMLASCAANPAPAPRPPVDSLMEGTDGALHAIVPREQGAYVVIIFFSPECHILAAHDDRLRKLVTAFGSSGVHFLAVDSEVDANIDRDRALAEERRYPFPILLDRGADLARSLGARYAGHTVIIDHTGAVRYQGGIDSDRVKLHDDATAYLADALTDLLAGKPPRVAESKSLGCALRLR
jgi:peroxiredoxin